MAFKTRRQRRYEILRKAGFMRSEARDLSRVPLKVPYMKPLIDARAKEYKKAVKEEWTIGQWEDTLKKQYKSSGWLNSKGKSSAWAMLRDYEHAYRAKHPNYDSPWQKRRGQMRDFIKVFEKKLAELPKRPPMTEATRLRIEAQQQEMEQHFKEIKERREARG